MKTLINKKDNSSIYIWENIEFVSENQTKCWKALFWMIWSKDWIIEDIDSFPTDWEAWKYLFIDWEFILDQKKEEIRKENIQKEAYKEFVESLEIINEKYTRDEQQTFDLKLREAEKVLSGWESVFLTALCVDWETTKELAETIKINSINYQMLYAQAEKILREKLKS